MRPVFSVIIGVLFSSQILFAASCSTPAIGEFDASGSQATSLVLPSMEAGSLSKSLGFNVNGQSADDLQWAKEAGAVEVRIQLGWDSVEKADGTLALSPQSESFLEKCSTLGLEPLLVAGYGPGWTTLAPFTVAQDAAVGARLISVKESLDAVHPLQDYVVKKPSTQLVAAGLWAYPGALIESTGEHQITLGAPLAVPLQAGDILLIHHRFYPAPSQKDDDPSVRAYVRYVQFLASRLAAHHLKGRIEIWNEPPWAHDLWDGGLGCFENPKVHGDCASPNFAFARALLRTTPPAGVRYVWGGTHKSGFDLLLGGPKGRIGEDISKSDLERTFVAESFHPYASTPEDHMWDPACLTTVPSNLIYKQCSPEGTNPGSNFKAEAQVSDKRIQDGGWGIDRVISEIGINTPDDTAKARFWLRAFLTYSALHFSRITFYTLSEKTPKALGFGIVNATTSQPSSAYAAMKSLMSELRAISGKAQQTASVHIASYKGSYPLLAVPVTGRSASGEDHTWIALWQRTYPHTKEDNALTLAPATGVAELTLPTGWRVARAWSLVDQSCTRFSEKNGILHVAFQADPVIVDLVHS